MSKGGYLVCQGAECQCDFGTASDKLKVISHTKEYINDREGEKKLIGNTKDLGQPFESGGFKGCKKKGSGPPPCTPQITEWKDYYENVELENEGKVLLEQSIGVCAIGGPCVRFTTNGQVSEPSNQNMERADEDVHTQLNPTTDVTMHKYRNEQPQLAKSNG